MTPLALLVLAAALALGGAQLRQVRLLDRAARLGVPAWQSLSLGAISAVTLAGLTLVVPASSLGGDVASLLRACVFTLQAAYAAPTELPGVTAGALLAGRTWGKRGSTGGQPAALTAQGEEVLVATGDGRIVQSTDGGRTFTVRYQEA